MVDHEVLKEEWFKLYMNATSMQFHVEREFNAEYSEIFIYDSGDYYKYFVKYEETGATPSNCTKGKVKKPLTKMSEPFNFVLIAKEAEDKGPLLFETFHAEAYAWEDRHAY